METPKYNSCIQIYEDTLEREYEAPQTDVKSNMRKAYSAIVAFANDNLHFLNFCDPSISRLPHVQMFYAQSTDDIAVTLRAESTPEQTLFNSDGTRITSIAINLSSFNTPTQPLESKINAAIKNTFKSQP